MSLSSVGKHELLTLPSAHQHGRFSSSQPAQLSRKRVCTPRPGCNHCPDTHQISSWPPPCDPAKHTRILSPLKRPQRECVRGFLSWRQVPGGGQWLTSISREKRAKGYQCEPGTQSYLTLPRPLLAFLCAIHLLYSYLHVALKSHVVTSSAELHGCAPLLQHYNKPYFNCVSVDTASSGMKFDLNLNCFLVKFLVPLKGRSKPDISFPRFNYCKCFVRASNLPWMQQSILRTRTDEKLTHLN